MDNFLLYLSGNDIPFQSAGLLIKQPNLKSIALVGEQGFFNGCSYLTFSKNKLDIQDKTNLQDFTDFNVLMRIMSDKNVAIQQVRVQMQLVLTLIFPNYRFVFRPADITLQNMQDNSQIAYINQETFPQFSDILNNMFCLREIKGSSQYNPKGPQARALVKKFEQRRRKLRGKEDDNVSILALYASILSVGAKKDINQLMQYSVFQLFEEFNRFQKRQNFNLYIQAKLAGAQDLKEVDNWTDNFHSQKKRDGLLD